MLYHNYSLIRTLVVTILLLLAVLPVASSINVPPPLPEHEWVGKSHFNYTELHDHFAEVLCLSLHPRGGVWFLLLVHLGAHNHMLDILDRNYGKGNE